MDPPLHRNRGTGRGGLGRPQGHPDRQPATGVASTTYRGREGEVRVATLNVGSMAGRGREVADMLRRRGVDICCVQEVQYKGNASMMVGGGGDGFKLWWAGEQGQRRGGVGVMMREEMMDKVVKVERVSPRIMKICVVMGSEVCQIFSVYAPQSGRPEREREEFWEALDTAIGVVPETERLIIAGDLNGHVGENREGFECVMGPYGFGERNRDGLKILEFCQGRNLTIVNTTFLKDREKRITYKSGGAESQIDYILVRCGDMVQVRDSKVIPGEACIQQHRLLCMDAAVRGANRGRKERATGARKIREWKLKDEEKRAEFRELFSQKMGEQEEGWVHLRDSILAAAREVCGETTGKGRREKRETWWWNATVQSAIKEKRVAFKIWQKCRSSESKRVFKEKSKTAKREVAIAKRTGWEEWSRDLNGMEGRKKMYKLAKQMKKESEDTAGAKYVKGENGDIKLEKNEIMERWRGYFELLLNEENPCVLEEAICTQGPVEQIQEEEVRWALGKMRRGRAAGPTGVSSDLLREVGDDGLRILTKIFQEIIEGGEIPDDWKLSLTVPIYKGKGDALDCGRYRGIRLLEHGMKVFEKVLEVRLRRIIQLDSRQFGFCPGKSTTDALFIMRRIQEGYSQKKRNAYHIFVDLEKAFDRVPRKVIEWALRRQRVPEKLIAAVMQLYVGTKSRVRTVTGLSEEFGIGVGVHQGSPLSPLLFITVMEEVTEVCRGDGIWELLYADDLVLTAESKQEVIEKFNSWKSAMERGGLRVNMDKTKGMVTGGRMDENIQVGKWPCACCGKGVGNNSIRCGQCGKWCHQRCSGLRRVQGVQGFVCPRCQGERRRVDEEAIDMSWPVDGGTLEEVQQFCYLGNVLDREADVERAVRARVAAAWMKWWELSSLLKNRGIPLKDRCMVYETCVRPVMLYGSETWALTDRLTAVLTTCDRKMLRYMTGVRWDDGVTSREVAERCGLSELEDKLRRSRLRWFGHVVRSDDQGILRRAEQFQVPVRRPRGRPKQTWRRCVDGDMRKLGIEEELAIDRKRWKYAIERPTP